MLSQFLSAAMGPQGLSRGTDVTVRACQMVLVTTYDRSCAAGGGVIRDAQSFDLTELSPLGASIGERLPDRTPVRWRFRPDVLQTMEDINAALKHAFPVQPPGPNADVAGRNAMATQLMDAARLGSREQITDCSGPHLRPPIVLDLNLLVASDRADQVAHAVTERVRMCTMPGVKL